MHCKMLDIVNIRSGICSSKILVDKAIDFCLLFVNDEIKASQSAGKPVFYRTVGIDMTLLLADYDSLTSIEDVIMIGYPNGRNPL